MTNMKIVYISHGSFTHIRPYIDFFKDAGHEVLLFKLAPGPDYGVQSYDLSIGKDYTASLSKIKYLLSAYKARRLIKEIAPDIVHTQYATSGGLAGLICGFNPTVVTAHGSDLTTGIQSRLWRPLLKRIFKQAACVNVVSHDLKKMVLDLGVSEDKTEVLTLGIDTKKFHFKQDAPFDRNRPLKIVCTRRLETVYDHPTIIKALSILNQRGIDFKMTFVGYGELESDLKKKVSELGLTGHVVFLGGCENSEMPQYLQDNDVYLSASFWDGTSLCLLEAMACGCFPIVSDIPANSAWVQNAKTGFLHGVEDPESLAQCIEAYIQDYEKYVHVLTVNRENVEMNGDRERNMQKLEAIYRNLLNE